MFLTEIFTDSLIDPKHLDYSDLNWSYPIPTRDLTVYPEGEGHLITEQVYRSKLIALDALSEFDVPYLDLVVYCHGVPAATAGSVRALCWKQRYDVTSETAPLGELQMVLVNNVGLIDTHCSTVNNSAATYFLRIAQEFDNVQLVIANACTGVSAYIRDPTTLYKSNPAVFRKTYGVKQ